MSLRRCLAALALLLLLAALPAAAQYDVADTTSAGATFGDIFVMNEDDPGICTALAAGLAEHAIQSFIPDREPALASRVFAEAPIRFDDLGCGESFYRDLLDCIVLHYARLRRDLLDDGMAVEEARRLHRERALACAAEEFE
ncbi:hypothetical protein C882_2596 [Caenispirillum salinarum AK4]|uniref:Rap1a immunity protein domain-containing protein n=1 Tax=Caenispirillum salinarum AK4 TaxID=1238182 RepID=K9H4L6_9PROT|nr:hypothetical protein [Caenispirillum salinarum]EKV32517.1 hypothetical protein C882_2596 [Caenispirillum salinarum AK4]